MLQARPKIEAEDPDALLEELNGRIARVYDDLWHNPNPPAGELQAITMIIGKLARWGPEWVLEAGFASASEVLMHMLVRLQLLVHSEIHSQNGIHDRHALQLPEGIQRVLPVADGLMNMLVRLSDSHTKLMHIRDLAERRKVGDGKRKRRQSNVGRNPSRAGNGQVAASVAGNRDA